MLEKNGHETYACFLLSLKKLANLDDWLILNDFFIVSKLIWTPFHTGSTGQAVHCVPSVGGLTSSLWWWFNICNTTSHIWEVWPAMTRCAVYNGSHLFLPEGAKKRYENCPAGNGPNNTWSHRKGTLSGNSFFTKPSHILKSRLVEH